MERVPLSRIVSLYLSELDVSSHAFQRMYTIAQRGRVDLDLDITGVIKTVTLDVNYNKTASLPVDFMNYTKLGLLDGRGQIVSFGYNEQLSSFNAESPDRLISETFPNSSCDAGLPLWNRRGSDGLSASLGIGSAPASKAYFKIDVQAGVVIFNPTMPFDAVTLEYLSSGSEEEGEESIPLYAQEALMAWCEWRDIKGKHGPANAQKDAMAQYYNWRRICRARTNGMQMHHINEAVRETTMQSINY